MALDLRQMEQDILEVVRDIGDIGFRDSSHSPASKVLIEKYIDKDDPWQSNQQLTVLVDYLVEERYLFPVFNQKGEVSGSYARGITPKGLKRLRELQAPRRTWFKENWFPVIVAGITTMIGIGSIVVDLIVNRN